MSADRTPARWDLPRRILGPDQPEVSCEECFAQLDRYVELELDGADADAAVPGMRAHLEGCAACGEEHRSLLALIGTGPALPEPPGERT